MSAPITSTHRGITITLHEDNNEWHFTVNGRDRKAPSIPKAREFIDRALDSIAKGEVKKFQPIDAVHCAYSEVPVLCRVTGLAGKDYSGREAAWINLNGDRSKVWFGYLFDASENNIKLMGEMVALSKQIENLNGEIRAKRKKLTPLPIPPDPTA